MSKINDLIQEMCPEGIQAVTLREVLDYEQPIKYLVSSTDYQNTYSTPVLTAGQTFVLGYTDELEGIYPASGLEPVIIFDDFTTAFKWVDFPFKAKSSAMKMLTSKDSNKANLRYLYHALQTIRYVPQDHARQWISNYSGFTVPLPPIEIQLKIVEVLDAFIELEAELEAELKLRRRQSTYYVDSVLQNSIESDGEWKRLDEVASIFDGTHQTPTYLDAGIKFVSVENIRELTNSNKYISELDFHKLYKNKPSFGDVLMTRIGSVGECAVVETEEPLAYYVSLALIKPNKEVISGRYIKHYLESKFGQKELNKRTLHDAVPKKINLGDIGKIQIWVPSMSIQSTICQRLRVFQEISFDMYFGIPAELYSRRKQYEYYRDKLLTFKELAE